MPIEEDSQSISYAIGKGSEGADLVRPLVLPFEVYSTETGIQVEGWAAYSIGGVLELPPFSPEKAAKEELLLLAQISARRLSH